MQKASSSASNNAQPVSDSALSVSVSEETSDALHRDVRRLNEEAEQLKVKLSAFERAEQVEEEGSISVVDQISSQVEEIRKELTARHEARVKQAEDKYNARAQNMKETLNKRLAANRAEMQQKLEASNADAVTELKQQHSTEIDALNHRHAAEIAELKLHSDSGTEVARRESQDVVEDGSQTDAWEPTDAEVRTLLQRNALAKKLVLNSLNNRERTVREEEQKKLKEQLGDLESKIAKAKKDAEGMVEAKFAAKFNLTENRLKTAQVKVEYVQNAAKETPDKVVGEVWAAAKDIKPAAAAPKPAVQGQATTSAPPTNVKDAEAAGATQASSDAAATPAQANPFATGSKPNPFASQGAQEGAARKVGFGQPAPAPNGQPDAASSQTQAAPQRTSKVPTLQQSSHAPQGPATQGTNQAAATNGTAAGAPVSGAFPPRGQQSGLPVASGPRGGGPQRGGQQRGRGGSGIARPGGRGSGIGRGTMQSVNTTLAQNAQAAANSQGSPQSGRAMNPNAQQFVPQKRTRDESGTETSEQAGDEKRLKADSA